jgi:hypothetical protein
MVDLPYDDAWPSAMWAGQTIFSGEVPDKIQNDALRFLNAVGGWLGVEEVKR